MIYDVVTRTGEFGINSSKVYCKSQQLHFIQRLVEGINSSKVYCK